MAKVGELVLYRESEPVVVNNIAGPGLLRPALVMKVDDEFTVDVAVFSVAETVRPATDTEPESRSSFIVSSFHDKVKYSMTEPNSWHHVAESMG